MSKRTKAKAAKESERSSEPQLVERHTWYYEERNSILVVHQTPIDENSGTIEILIPYAMLRATLARVDGTAKPRKMLQSAKTGRAVSKAYAAENPDTTFRQAVGKGRGRRT